MATVRELLESAVAALRAAGSESPRLDAELLLAHSLRVDRTAVLAHPEAQVGDGPRAAYGVAIERRQAGEPVAYIRGVKEFYGLAFAVDARALIPRPETETLVELALQRIAARLTSAPRPAGSPPLRVLDVGTGSGAITVALATSLRRRRYDGAVRFTASDLSAEALALAVENAVSHGVADLIDFREADLLDLPVHVGGRADLIVANLPYVPSPELPGLPLAARFEPPLALDGGSDGLDVLRRLLDGLPEALARDGCALLEIGADQGAALVRLATRRLSGWRAVIHPDLGGQPRVVELAP